MVESRDVGREAGRGGRRRQRGGEKVWGRVGRSREK